MKSNNSYNNNLILFVLVFSLSIVLSSVIFYQLGLGRQEKKDTEKPASGEDTILLDTLAHLHQRMDSLFVSQRSSARFGQIDTLKLEIARWEERYSMETNDNELLKFLLLSIKKRLEDFSVLAHQTAYTPVRPVTSEQVEKPSQDREEIQQCQESVAAYTNKFSRIRNKASNLPQTAITLRKLHGLLRNNWIQGENDKQNKAFLLITAQYLEELNRELAP